MIDGSHVLMLMTEIVYIWGDVSNELILLNHNKHIASYVSAFYK